MALQSGWDLVFAGALLFALLIGTSRFEAWLRPRWLQFFGDISYGLYLIHVLVFMVYARLFHPANNLRGVLWQFVIGSAVSIGLAALSRYTIRRMVSAIKGSNSVVPCRPSP